jgi:ketosteroid isomerase-like protein
MKQRIFFLAALAWGLIACGMVFRSYAQKKTTDEAEIKALHQRYIAAFNKKDVATIMSCYLPGSTLFVFDVTPPRQHVGWDDYKKDWEYLFAAFPGPLHNEISDLSITIGGQLAFSHHIESGYFTRRNGTKLPIAVRVTDAYRKVDGKWLIVQEHVSVPVDIDTGKADLLSKP